MPDLLLGSALAARRGDLLPPANLRQNRLAEEPLGVNDDIGQHANRDLALHRLTPHIMVGFLLTDLSTAHEDRLGAFDIAHRAQGLIQLINSFSQSFLMQKMIARDNQTGSHLLGRDRLTDHRIRRAIVQQCQVDRLGGSDDDDQSGVRFTRQPRQPLR